MNQESCGFASCDGKVYILFTGDVYCPTCERSYGTGYELCDETLDEYHEYVELFQENPEKLYEEYIRLVDVYMKEPVGFPNEESYAELLTLLPLLPLALNELRNEMAEKEARKLKSKVNSRR